jgi:hypothetical protein
MCSYTCVYCGWLSDHSSIMVNKRLFKWLEFSVSWHGWMPERNFLPVVATKTSSLKLGVLSKQTWTEYGNQYPVESLNSALRNFTRVVCVGYTTLEYVLAHYNDSDEHHILHKQNQQGASLLIRPTNSFMLLLKGVCFGIWKYSRAGIAGNFQGCVW